MKDVLSLILLSAFAFSFQAKAGSDIKVGFQVSLKYTDELDKETMVDTLNGFISKSSAGLEKVVLDEEPIKFKKLSLVEYQSYFRNRDNAYIAHPKVQLVLSNKDITELVKRLADKIVINIPLKNKILKLIGSPYFQKELSKELVWNFSLSYREEEFYYRYSDRTVIQFGNPTNKTGEYIVLTNEETGEELVIIFKIDNRLLISKEVY